MPNRSVNSTSGVSVIQASSTLAVFSVARNRSRSSLSGSSSGFDEQLRLLVGEPGEQLRLLAAPQEHRGKVRRRRDRGEQGERARTPIGARSSACRRTTALIGSRYSSLVRTPNAGRPELRAPARGTRAARGTVGRSRRRPRARRSSTVWPKNVAAKNDSSSASVPTCPLATSAEQVHPERRLGREARRDLLRRARRGSRPGGARLLLGPGEQHRLAGRCRTAAGRPGRTSAGPRARGSAPGCRGGRRTGTCRGRSRGGREG